jgi:hypothetical protein
MVSPGGGGRRQSSISALAAAIAATTSVAGVAGGGENDDDSLSLLDTLGFGFVGAPDDDAQSTDFIDTAFRDSRGVQHQLLDGGGGGGGDDDDDDSDPVPDGPGGGVDGLGGGDDARGGVAGALVSRMRVSQASGQ